jgi:hypothetical protein
MRQYQPPTAWVREELLVVQEEVQEVVGLALAVVLPRRRKASAPVDKRQA